MDGSGGRVTKLLRAANVKKTTVLCQKACFSLVTRENSRSLILLVLSLSVGYYRFETIRFYILTHF